MKMSCQHISPPQRNRALTETTNSVLCRVLLKEVGQLLLSQSSTASVANERCHKARDMRTCLESTRNTSVLACSYLPRHTMDVPLRVALLYFDQAISQRQEQCQARGQTRPTVVPSIPALMTSTPGAKMSTSGPKFEKSARTSLMLVAPTVIASATRAGLWLVASRFLFPADTCHISDGSIHDSVTCAQRLPQRTRPG